MIRTTPRRRITLQCSQIGLTLLRTFMTDLWFIEQLFNIAADLAADNPCQTPEHALPVRFFEGEPGG
jgi:hypothetical protein